MATLRLLHSIKWWFSVSFIIFIFVWWFILAHFLCHYIYNFSPKFPDIVRLISGAFGPITKPPQHNRTVIGSIPGQTREKRNLLERLPIALALLVTIHHYCGTTATTERHWTRWSWTAASGRVPRLTKRSRKDMARLLLSWRLRIGAEMRTARHMWWGTTGRTDFQFVCSQLKGRLADHHPPLDGRPAGLSESSGEESGNNNGPK